MTFQEKLANPGSLESEFKYELSSDRVPVFSQWLNHACVPDPEYPSAKISSIYFDTLTLKSVSEKYNSDYLKTKLRLRWYDLDTELSQVFLEAKFKIGSRREKVRIPTDLDAHDLVQSALNDSRFLPIPSMLKPHGINLEAYLPLFTLSYRRNRYLDPVSGLRLSLDSEIKISKVNPQLVAHQPPCVFPTAVCEVKGNFVDVPGNLNFLTTLGCKKSSFSKFGIGYRLLTQQPF